MNVRQVAALTVQRQRIKYAVRLGLFLMLLTLAQLSAWYFNAAWLDFVAWLLVWFACSQAYQFGQWVMLEKVLLSGGEE